MAQHHFFMVSDFYVIDVCHRLLADFERIAFHQRHLIDIELEHAATIAFAKVSERSNLRDLKFLGQGFANGMIRNNNFNNARLNQLQGPR